jgi:hypothetical protein
MPATLFKEADAPFRSKDDRFCPICQRDEDSDQKISQENLCMLPCLHIFCIPCIQEYVSARAEDMPDEPMLCPTCQVSVEADCGHLVDLLALPDVDWDGDWDAFLKVLDAACERCRYCMVRVGLSEMLTAFDSGTYVIEDVELERDDMLDRWLEDPLIDAVRRVEGS